EHERFVVLPRAPQSSTPPDTLPRIWPLGPLGGRSGRSQLRPEPILPEAEGVADPPEQQIESEWVVHPGQRLEHLAGARDLGHRPPDVLALPPGPPDQPVDQV